MVDVTTYDAEHVRLGLERGKGQGPPLIVATLTGTSRGDDLRPVRVVDRAPRRAPARGADLEVVATEGRYLVSGIRGEAERAPVQAASVPARFGARRGVRSAWTSATARSATACPSTRPR